MQKILTLIPAPEDGCIPLREDLFCAPREYTDAEVEAFIKEASYWELTVETDLQYVEWYDGTVYIKDIAVDMFVVDRGALVGLYYDPCYFDLADPKTHVAYEYPAQPRKAGRNYVGGYTYFLRHRPDDRVVYSEDGRTLISFPRNYAGPFTVPDHVTEIALGAFRKCALLTEVVIPASVETIGQYAFEGCTALKKKVIASHKTQIDDGSLKRRTEL